MDLAPSATMSSSSLPDGSCALPLQVSNHHPINGTQSTARTSLNNVARSASMMEQHSRMMFSVAGETKQTG